jgi:hypothetical protein
MCKISQGALGHTNIQVSAHFLIILVNDIHQYCFSGNETFWMLAIF